MSGGRALCLRSGHGPQSAVSFPHQQLILPVCFCSAHTEWLQTLLGELFDRCAPGQKQFACKGGEVGNLERGRWQTLSIISHPREFLMSTAWPSAPKLLLCNWGDGFGLRYWTRNNLHHKEYGTVSAKSVLLITKKRHDK